MKLLRLFTHWNSEKGKVWARLALGRKNLPQTSDHGRKIRWNKRWKDGQTDWLINIRRSQIRSECFNSLRSFGEENYDWFHCLFRSEVWHNIKGPHTTFSLGEKIKKLWASLHDTPAKKYSSIVYFCWKVIIDAPFFFKWHWTWTNDQSWRSGYSFRSHAIFVSNLVYTWTRYEFFTMTLNLHTWPWINFGS